MGSPVKSRVLFDRAKLAEELVDMQSQLHQHALECPFLIYSLKTFYQVHWQKKKKELNNDFLAMLVLFSLLDRGKT